MPIHRNALILTVALLAAALCGCATLDQRVNPAYKPVAAAQGGGGPLALTTTGLSPAYKDRPVLWIVGTVKNGDGEKMGNLTSQRSSEELLRDAFEQELAAAGYTVSQDAGRPEAAAKAVNISRVRLTLDEKQTLLKVEGACTVSVSLELWSKGAVVKRLEYESRFSDFAVKDREMLMSTVLRTTLQNLMTRAVPEIVAVLGGS